MMEELPGYQPEILRFPYTLECGRFLVPDQARELVGEAGPGGRLPLHTEIPHERRQDPHSSPCRLFLLQRRARKTRQGALQGKGFSCQRHGTLAGRPETPICGVVLILSSLRRTVYASFLRLSCALHMDISGRPAALLLPAEERPSGRLLLVDAYEPLNAPVVALLDRIREIAGGQLAAGPVVGDALAADAFPGAGIVAAIAVLHVFCLVGALLFARLDSSFRFPSFPLVFFSAFHPGVLSFPDRTVRMIP